MSLIPSDCPKPDLFLFQLPKQEPIDVTNYKIDNFLNLLNTYEQDELTIRCLYESSDFGIPIVNYIDFGIDGPIYFSINFISNGNIVTDEVSYNNKTYYYYRIDLI